MRLPALAPALTVAVILGPVAAGLGGLLLPAAGHLPSVGLHGPSLGPVRALLETPGLGRAVALSAGTGLVATILSLATVMVVLAGWSGTRAFALVRRVLSPLLSVPHAAVAFSIAFLIAPSGWIARLLSPEVTGWQRPPDLLIVNDPWGTALTVGLVAKEVPFLLLMSLAMLGQIDVERRLRVAQSLGHDRITGWLFTVAPALYARIRLPVLVVLAYSMSVVDMAMILGPTRPPTLSVMILRWMGDFDLTSRSLAAVGALLQLALVLLAIGLWSVLERLAAAAGRRAATSGRRVRTDGLLRPAGLAMAVGIGLAAAAGFAVLGLWSVAGPWPFPDIAPGDPSLRHWTRAGGDLADLATTTAILAAMSAGLALLLTLGCLEAEDRRGLALSRPAEWILFAPLLVPQIAFLPGLQILLLRGGMDDGMLPVALVHTVFVLPYVFLSLSGPWRTVDPRYAAVARTLGAGHVALFLRVRLPIMLGPIVTATAVGIAVSVAQYLPTLLAGGGLVRTLTTEAVALSSGGDRRLIGVYALAQTALGLAPFAAALALPALVWRNRRALRA